MKTVRVNPSKPDRLGFELDGKPLAQSRVRFSRGRVYDPLAAKKLEVKSQLKAKLKSQLQERFKLSFIEPSLEKRKPEGIEFKESEVSKGRNIEDISEYSKITQKDNIDENSVYFASNQFLSVNIIFYTPIPKSCSKAKKIALEGMFDNNKPDIDNYVKFYLDAFNQLLYPDDRNIVSLYAEKRKSCNPRVKVEIESL